MKKLLSIIITLVLLICTFSLVCNAVETPSFSLDEVSGKAGDTVTLNLNINNNPGITTFRLNVEFPDDALELKNVEYKNLLSSPASGLDKYETPFIISWFSTKSQDENNNGIIAAFTFKIKDSAKSDSYPIKITYAEDDLCNSSLTNIHFDIVDGKINVEHPHIHNLTYVPENKSTCTQNGSKAYYVCNDCGKWFEDDKATKEITDHNSVVIKASHTPSDWIVDKEATENEKGSMHKECTVCKEILETKEIPVITDVQPTTVKNSDPTGNTENQTKSENTATNKQATADSVNNSAIQTGNVGALLVVSVIAIFAFFGLYILSVKRNKIKK